jgi:hypothetical protein
MAAGSIVLGAVGLLLAVLKGGVWYWRVLGMLLAFGGAFAGAKQSQTDKEEGNSPALAYVGVVVSVLALLVGVVRAITG